MSAPSRKRTRAAGSAGSFGSSRAAMLIRKETSPGAMPFARAAIFAVAPSTSSLSPRSIARTIRLAARSALIAVKGDVDDAPNHASSSSAAPLKCACAYEPVRIRPGNTVRTSMRSFASSARSASAKPTSANFAVVYGAR